MSQRIQGVMVGLVTDVNDPEGLGRVRLHFPTLSDSNASNWARVAAPLAGPQRGFFFLPEVDDEALVAFENGDINRPYILGYLWNGQDKPPTTDQPVRIVQTVSGHKLTFDDTQGSETILIEDAKGNKITMNSDGITIEAVKDVTIKGIKVNVEATAQLTAKGKPIHLNP